jgi:adenosylhomocysteine nucleosidase
LPDRAKVAIIAALEREVHGFVESWQIRGRDFEGRRFRFYESGSTVLVCSGIGALAARHATQAAIALYRPSMVQSVGFAGALDPALKVGEIVIPERVMDSGDGSSVQTSRGSGTLLTVASVSGTNQKRRWAAAYAAQAIDMEAAAVARGAITHGLEFSAVKVISDEAGFDLPGMDRFIGSDGSFQQGRFLLQMALRPWLWSRVFRLAVNTSRASRELCQELKRQHCP